MKYYILGFFYMVGLSMFSCQIPVITEYREENQQVFDSGEIRESSTLEEAETDANSSPCYLYFGSTICECNPQRCPRGQLCYQAGKQNQHYCLKMHGMSCKEHRECLVGNCQNGVCRPSFSGEACVTNADCYNNKCVMGGSAWTRHSCGCEKDDDCKNSTVSKICTRGHCISYEECLDRMVEICQKNSQHYQYELQPCDCNYCICDTSGKSYCTSNSCLWHSPHWLHKLE